MSRWPLGPRLLLAAPARLRRPPWPRERRRPAPPPADPVVAKVDGQPIHLSDLKDAAQALPENLRGMPPQTLYPMLLDQMIDAHALVAEARKSGPRQGPGRAAPGRRGRGPGAADRGAEQGGRAAGHRRRGARPLRPGNRRQARRGGGARQAHPGGQRGRGEEDHRRAEGRRATSPRSPSSTARIPAAAQQGGDLGFFKKDDMVPEFADRRLRPEARPGVARRRCTASSAGMSSRWWSAAAPSRRASTRRATNCARR